MKRINPYELERDVRSRRTNVVPSSHALMHTGGHQGEKNCFTVTSVCPCLFWTWPTSQCPPHPPPLPVAATHTSLLQCHWYGSADVVLLPFILIDGLLPRRHRKKPSLIGHDTASQLSIWSMCAAWIQATALVVEAPSRSPWIHIAAHILLLLWSNCFVIAAQTGYNTVSI